MSRKYRMFMLVLALVAALTMVIAMTSVSFASGDKPPANGATVCVSGYVINHREQPVDGTRFDPQMKVYAIGVPGTMTAADLPDLAATFADAEALSAMAAGVDACLKTDGSAVRRRCSSDWRCC